jgi:hypothetical protein
MRSLLFLAAFFIALAGTTPAAVAIPAPMSDSELLSRSELVGLIRVLSVTCTSVSKDERTGEELPSYSAKAELMYVTKGDETLGDDITLSFHAIPTGVLGPWTVFYYPGEMVWTHLVKEDGAYTTTWWNGKGRIVSKAVITELPTTPGETVEVPRRNAQTRN